MYYRSSENKRLVLKLLILSVYTVTALDTDDDDYKEDVLRLSDEEPKWIQPKYLEQPAINIESMYLLWKSDTLSSICYQKLLQCLIGGHVGRN